MKQALWECPDETAAEVELGDLLYGLVRMLKPQIVVETGTYKGQTTAYLGRAVYDNGFGSVFSCDTQPGKVIDCNDPMRDFANVFFRQCSSLDLPELAQADFIFSDSDYRFRQKEIELAKPGATILVHDTKISYDSTIPPLEGLVREMGGLTFDTHRGFGLIRKR